MKTNLLTVTNAKFMAAVENNNSVVGYVMALLDVNNQVQQEVLGMFDIYRAPISDILVSKGGFKLTIENNLPVILDSHGNHYTYEFFEKMEKSSGKKFTTAVNQLPPETQAYLSEQVKLFNEHILSKQVQPQAQPTPVAQPQPTPVPQPVPQSTPVPTPQPQVQPTPVAQPTPQPQVIPTPQPQVIPQPQGQSIRKNPNEYISTDDFPIGTFLVRSVIDPNACLPEYVGLNEQGQKVYGPDRCTEEECIAIIQLKNIVYSAGEHLLTEKEKELLDELNEGRTEKTDKQNDKDGLDMNAMGLIDTLNKIRATMLQRITQARRTEKNVLQIKEEVERALRENVPFELLGKRYSFYYMSLVDENGNPIKPNQTFLERATQLKTNGKIVSKTTKQVSQIAKPITMPTAGLSAPNMGGTPRPVISGNAPQQITPNDSPFTRPVGMSTPTGMTPPVQKSTKTATAIIRNFVTTDGHTIEGIIFDINGTVQGKELNKRCVNSLEALGRAFNALSRQVEFSNAELVMNNGKLEVIMSDEHLNIIDIIPEKRFVYADEIGNSSKPVSVFLNRDTKLHEMIDIAKARHTNQQAEQPVQQPQPTPQPMAQPVAQPVAQPQPTQQPVAQATTTVDKPMPESVKQFVNVLKETTASILPITDVSTGVPKVVMLNVAEMRQYLGI